MNKTIAKNFEDFAQLFSMVKQSHPEGYLEVIIRPWKAKRSLDQNSLYWMWVGILAKHFSKKIPVSKEGMHDILRHKHLGYEDKHIGNTLIPGQLKSTTDLTVPEMSEYMTKVEAWAAEHGCLLPRPEDQDHVYNMYREAAA